MVHELEVHMGLGRVARVAAIGEMIARGHHVARLDADGATTEMGKDDVETVADLDRRRGCPTVVPGPLSSRTALSRRRYGRAG